MNNIALVEQWLFEKHIKVNREWLQACFDWLLEQLPSPSLGVLNDAVYKQWITEDLREMGCQSLPPRINGIHKIMLTNKYIFQINSLRDISQPSYGQLLKVKGDGDQGNINVSAAPKEAEPIWKSQPKRMLYMEITDGNQELHAMEYKAIPALSLSTSPGTKILVSGPVECRMGVLLLTSKNVQVLGGHVEALSSLNTLENVLTRALGVPASTTQSTQSQRLRDSDIVPPIQDLPHTTTTAATERVASGNSRPNSTINTTRPNENLNRARLAQVNRSAPSDDDDFSNDRRTTAQKRLFSQSLEDDFQNEDDDVFDSIDVDMLEQASQVQASSTPVSDQTRQQEFHRSGDGFDDINFANFEMQIQDEMDNMEMSYEEPTVPRQHLPEQHKARTDKQIDWKTPFSYLSSLDTSKFSSNKETADHVIVKGFISGVSSRLKPHPVLGWQLAAIIDDGTKSLEVDLSDAFLTKLFGLTVKEMMKMKSEANTNPQLIEQIYKSVNECQQSLQNLNGLMELVLVSPRPFLLQHLPFEKKHLRLLAVRVTKACR